MSVSKLGQIAGAVKGAVIRAAAPWSHEDKPQLQDYVDELRQLDEDYDNGRLMELTVNSIGYKKIEQALKERLAELQAKLWKQARTLEEFKSYQAQLTELDHCIQLPYDLIKAGKQAMERKRAIMREIGLMEVEQGENSVETANAV